MKLRHPGRDRPQDQLPDHHDLHDAAPERRVPAAQGPGQVLGAEGTLGQIRLDLGRVQLDPGHAADDRADQTGLQRRQAVLGPHRRDDAVRDGVGLGAVRPGVQDVVLARERDWHGALFLKFLTTSELRSIGREAHGVEGPASATTAF
jgi:hypothetical protein